MGHRGDQIGERKEIPAFRLLPEFPVEDKTMKKHFKMARGFLVLWLLALSCAGCAQGTETGGGNSLRVLGGRYELQQCFEKEFGGSMMIANGVTDAGELAEKIAAGDDSFDLYYLMCDMPGAQKCLEMGAFYPLDQIDGVAAYFEKLPAQIEENCRYQGKLMGLPSYMVSSVLAVSPEILEEYGESLNSWDTAVAKGEQLFYQDPAKAFVGGASMAQNEMLRQYLCTYCGNGPVNFDTAEFRQVLAQMKQAQEYVGFQIPVDSMDVYQISMKNELLYWFREEENLAPLPRISQEAKYPLKMEWLVVNPNSPKIELIEKFLTHYITIDPPDYTGLLGTKIEGQLSDIQRENYQLYLQMMEDSQVAYCPRDLTSAAIPVLDAYYRGSIDTEETIARFQQIAAEVFGE
jgi:hypothetical protein